MQLSLTNSNFCQEITHPPLPINKNYIHLLDSFTKELLNNVPVEQYVSTLASKLQWGIIRNEEEVRIVRTDILLLTGFTEGSFEVCTTQSMTYSLYYSLYVTTNANDAYGLHKLAFKPQEEVAIVLPYETSRISQEILVKKEEDYFVASAYSVNNFIHLTKNLFFSKRLVKTAAHLFYFFKDRRAKLRINKSNHYDYSKLSQTLKNSFIQTLKEVTPSHIPSFIDYMPFKSIMMYLNNPLWRDLNSPFIPIKSNSYYYKNTIHLSYSTLKYHHSRYGSKKLREIFFKTSSKRLQNLVIDESSYKYLTFLQDSNNSFSDLNLDSKAKLITLIMSISNSSVYGLRYLNSCQYLYDEGYSLSRVFNSIEKGHSRLLVDSVNMLRSLTTEDKNTLNLKTSIEQFHDSVLRLYLRMKDQQYNGRVIELTEDEKEMHFEKDTYRFKPVELTDDLSLFGNSLNICVRSYDKQAIKKDCTIVVVYKNNLPYACIEIRDNTIVQSKLKRNMQTHTEPEFNTLVLEWADKNNLKVSTSDIEHTQ